MEANQADPSLHRDDTNTNTNGSPSESIATSNDEPKKRETDTHSLLSIPRELRDKIYRNILEAETTLEEVDVDSAENARYTFINRVQLAKIAFTKTDLSSLLIHELAQINNETTLYHKLLDTGILRVSKQIFSEASEVLHRENSFSFDLAYTKRQETLRYVPQMTINTRLMDMGCLSELFSVLTSHEGSLDVVQIQGTIPRSKYGRFRPRPYLEALEPLRKIRVRKLVQIDVSYQDIYHKTAISPRYEWRELVRTTLKSLEKVMNGQQKEEDIEWPIGKD